MKWRTLTKKKRIEVFEICSFQGSIADDMSIPQTTYYITVLQTSIIEKCFVYLKPKSHSIANLVTRIVGGFLWSDA